MFTVPMALGALAALGAPIVGALAGVGIAGVPAALAGGVAAALGAGSVGAGAVGAGAAAANPMIGGGIQAAANDAFNNAATGSANFVNGLNLPGVPRLGLN